MKRLVILALALMVAVPAVGQEITFEGMAVFDGDPQAVGSTMTVYGYSNGALNEATPFTTNYDLFEYTVHVYDMTVTSFNWDMVQGLKTWTFDPGFLDIYEDAGTPYDYQVPSTFTDGNLILSTTVDGGWEMLLSGIAFFSGAGEGYIDVTGGSAYAELVNLWYELDDWRFFGTGISDGFPPFIVPEPGYDLIFGVKIVYPYDPTGDEDATWGEVKTLFR